MSAQPSPVSLAAVLVRGDIWRGDALPGLPAGTIASGYAELDAELPGGGWPRGNLTEILVDRGGFGEISLLLPALARLSGEGGRLALVAPPWLPHAPAWAAAGVAMASAPVRAAALRTVVNQVRMETPVVVVAGGGLFSTAGQGHALL